MYSILELRKTVGPSHNVEPDDILALKKALNQTGHYKVPDFGITPYPDTPLIKGIKKFQKDHDLKVDGVMKPGGPTENALGRKLVASERSENSPLGTGQLQKPEKENGGQKCPKGYYPSIKRTCIPGTKICVETEKCEPIPYGGGRRA